MKKLAVLMLMIVSLVVTPVMAGPCNHDLMDGMQNAAMQAVEAHAGKVASPDSDTSGNSQTPDAAHVHCCGAHMAAIAPDGQAQSDELPVVKQKAASVWKQARYHSLNVGPLLEPPAHA